MFKQPINKTYQQPIGTMRPSVLPLLLLFPLIAAADEFFTLVTFSCDPKADRLVIEYQGAYNEAGERLVAANHPDTWAPSELRSFPPNDPAFTSPKTIVRSCALSDGIYVFRLKPVPEDLRNILGHCGDWETGQVSVVRNKHIIVDLQLDDSCFDWSKPVATRIVVTAGMQTPTVNTVSADDFHR